MRSWNSVKLSCDRAFALFFCLSKFYIKTLIYRVMQWLLPIQMNAICPVTMNHMTVVKYHMWEKNVRSTVLFSWK